MVIAHTKGLRNKPDHHRLRRNFQKTLSVMAIKSVERTKVFTVLDHTSEYVEYTDTTHNININIIIISCLNAKSFVFPLEQVLHIESSRL